MAADTLICDRMRIDRNTGVGTVNGIGEVWGMAADTWDGVVAQLGDADWEKSTPCDGWTVRELVDHAMFWQGQGASAFGAAAAEGDWPALRASLRAALDDPSNMEGKAEQFGGAPMPAVAGLITADLLVHSWDLAIAIGADATLPEAAAESTLMGLQRLPEQMLRNEQMFGPAIEVDADASAQDRLIGFVGRQP